MPAVPSIEQLQRRLVELGCPALTVRRIVRETAEHYEDLQQAAVRQGLPPAEAARLAAEQLGDPAVLAERHVAAWRNTLAGGFWPGVALVLSPLVVLGLPLVFWVGCPFFTFLAAFLGFELVRRAPAKSKWMILLACALTALEALLIPTTTLNIATPWLVAGLIYFGQRPADHPALIQP